MTQAVSVLHLEDNPDDAALIRHFLHAGGGAYDIVHVCDRSGFEAALATGPYDVVICDFDLPDLDGLAALALAQERLPHTPVIIVSGVMDARETVACLHAGATDYLLKERLERLPSAVRRALDEADALRVRREMMARLAESEERFRQLAEQSEDGFWFVGLQPERVLYASPAVETIWGLSARELSLDARLWLASIHPHDQPRVRTAWHAWTTGRWPQFLEEFRVVRPGGPIRWVSSSGTVIRDNSGAVVRLSILTRDVTEHRDTHEAARLQGAALHAAADAIVITDGSGVIEWVNPAFTQLTGYSAGEAVGKNPRDLLKSGQHAQSLYAELWETILAGRTWHGEMINRRKDGTLYTEHQAITPIPNASGVITHFVAIKRDVTGRLRLEAQLRQAQKMESIGQLAAGVAHEINTPVQFVSDSVHFLQEALGDLTQVLTRYQTIESAVLAGAPAVAVAAATEARQVEEAIDLADLLENTPKAIERALDGLSRIASIVRSMKDFARADQREMATADLNEAIRGTLAVARNEYKYVAEVETEFGELPGVLCHVGELSQVMLNLIVNAAHAIGDVVKDTGTKGRITIRTWRETHDVVMTVTDTGPGIPEAIRARIFDPFFTTKPIGQGSGQGLAIVWAIVVEKHRGLLTVDSTIGQGTTFAVRLPI